MRHTEIRLQDVTNSRYQLELFVGNQEIELEKKDNRTWIPVGWSGPRPPRGSNRATSPRRRRPTVVLTGTCTIWERAGCWLITSAAGLPVRGLVVVVPSSAIPPSYPFHYFIPPFPHLPLLAFPCIFSHFVHILLRQTSASCYAPGKSDRDWGSCPSSPREFHDL